ncbi:MAG TPA: DUF1127 domain-containing protein [Stellaceae bacterium]|nr:DUF1127 domain-containing protein [Stellaceae bacterium]
MLDFLNHALHNVGERLDEWRKYQQAYRELASLDDRALADIGVTRSEIPFILTHVSDPSRVYPLDAANQNGRHAA